MGRKWAVGDGRSESVKLGYTQVTQIIITGEEYLLELQAEFFRILIKIFLNDGAVFPKLHRAHILNTKTLNNNLVSTIHKSIPADFKP